MHTITQFRNRAICWLYFCATLRFHSYLLWPCVQEHHDAGVDDEAGRLLDQQLLDGRSSTAASTSAAHPTQQQVCAC